MKSKEMIQSNGLLRMITFVVGFVMLLVGASALLNIKWNKYNSYYQLEDQSVDYITLGASHCLYSLNPMYIYAKTGIKGYNLADEAQSIAFSYYWLKEAVKTNKPKVVFYDVGNLFYTDSYMVEDWKLKEYSAMKPSMNKAECINATAGTLESRVGGFFPIFYFHERWKSLKEEDFIQSSTATCGANTVFVVNGNASPDSVNLFEKDFYGSEEYSRENIISEENKSYFDKIVKLCREGKIQLIPSKFPTNAWDDERSAIVEQFLREYDLHLLNLNSMVPSIDWGIDSFDGGYHTNYWGGIKNSEAVGNYLAERINILNETEDEKWNGILLEYCDYETESLLNGEDRREAYWSWLVDVKSENLIVLSVNGFLSGRKKDINNWMKCLGLSGYSKSNYNQSYIAVIDKGDVLFEKWDDRIMQYDDSIDSVELSIASSGNKSHIGNAFGRAQITINGESVAEGSQGLNIVVYDKGADRVIASTTQYNASSWILERKSENAEDYYDLYSGKSDWMLGSAQGMTDIADQIVSIQYAGNGTYYIYNEEGRYLTVAGGYNKTDTPVLWQKYIGTAVQKWMLRHNFDGTYSLVSLYNHLYLGVGANQLFSVELNGDKPVMFLK